MEIACARGRLGITRLGSHSRRSNQVLRRQRLRPVKCERVEELLLSGEIKPAKSPSFYSCHSGGFVQLLPSACLDKLEARYLINANAQLNR